MPTYEFRCGKCQATFEVEESIAQHDQDVREHRARCPKCGSTEVAPLIADVSVRTAKKS